MAWRAELKRLNWYCIKGCSMVDWYSDFLYDEWWNSLTEEQQQRIIQRRKERESKEAEVAIMNLFSIGAALSRINSPYLNGIYDSF